MTLNKLIMMPTDDKLSELIIECQELELVFLFNKFNTIDKCDKIEFKGVTKACITEANDVTKAHIVTKSEEVDKVERWKSSCIFTS